MGKLFDIVGRARRDPFPDSSTLNLFNLMQLLLVIIPPSEESLASRRKELSAERQVATKALALVEKEFEAAKQRSRRFPNAELERLGHEVIRLRAAIEACEDGIVALDSIRKAVALEEMLAGQTVGAS